MTLAIDVDTSAGLVHGEAWGPGAEWALEQMPELLGSCDDWSGFEARHPILVEARRRHPDIRLGRSGLVMESLVPTIIGQKVTTLEAQTSFRNLVRRFGEPAPGPGGQVDLWVQPSPQALRSIASWDWLKLHVDGARSRPIVSSARVASSLERVEGISLEELDMRLRTVPGVGIWTSAEVRRRSFGDPDAVSFGDYHIAKTVGYALTGSPFDDDEMARLLEQWRPHRGRVVTLVMLSGIRVPRRGARMGPRTHLP
ncbi:DNA-3-methyladenine glycosylase family protein [Kribbella sp. CA-294648]|uniref:DNA-3-methyladenine glycosylase family protein n=1 Tax=Kribbella sp. CA-294648 TaxID=3239948 RepID=UPI003D9068E6